MKILSCVIPLEKKTKYEILFELEISLNSKINFYSKYNFLNKSASVGIRSYDEEVDSYIENSLEKHDLEWLKKFNIADMFVTAGKKENKLIFIKYDGFENKKINVKNYVVFKANDMFMRKIVLITGENLYFNRSKDFALYVDTLGH